MSIAAQELVLPERVATRIRRGPDCWEWIGYRSKTGYGFIKWERKTYTAHRLVWELLRGPIPEGLEVDHLCRNRGCVNPDHIELVSHAENMRRGEAAIKAAEERVARTHCPSGHPYDEANTYRFGPKRYRGCRKCRNAASAAYKRKVAV